MAGEATLISDHGAASAAPEFFRSAPFLAAEGVTHTLAIDSGSSTLKIPLIVRPIPGGAGWDATSPYGYPGGSAQGQELDLSEVTLSELGLVSIFIRDHVARASIRNARARSTLFIYDPSLPRHVRKSVARHVYKNCCAGYRTDVLSGSAVDALTIEEFSTCYRQTMRRIHARRRYYFSADYLRACLSFEGAWMVTTRAPDKSLAAAALIVRSDGYLHHFLGCTADNHLSESPSKNTCHAVLGLAREIDLPVNFGGGLRPFDGLEYFKRGFSNQQASFLTHELICDDSMYTRLSSAAGGEEKLGEGFFPIYRASR